MKTDDNGEGESFHRRMVSKRHGYALKLRGWYLGNLRATTYGCMVDSRLRDIEIGWSEIEHEEMGYVGYAISADKPYLMLNVSEAYGDTDAGLDQSISGRAVFRDVFSGGYMPETENDRETKDMWGCCPISNSDLWQFLKAEVYLRTNTDRYTNVMIVGLDCDFNKAKHDEKYLYTAVLFRRSRGLLHYFVIKTETLFDMAFTTLLDSVERHHTKLYKESSPHWRSYSSDESLYCTTYDTDNDHYGYKILSSGYEVDWREIVSCFELHMPHWFDFDYFMQMLVDRYNLKSDQHFLISAIQGQSEHISKLNDQVSLLRRQLSNLREANKESKPF